MEARRTGRTIKTTTRYETFRETYRHDPVGFLRDCILWPEGMCPTDYQLEIAAAIAGNQRVSVRGPHGLGKSFLSATIVHWFALTRDGLDWKVPTTASVWRQLSKFLWPEIHKVARMLNWKAIGREPYSERTELFTLSLRLETGEAFAITSDKPADMEGAHADHILYIFDESKTIQDGVWDAIEGALSTDMGARGDQSREAKILAVSTPGEPKGRFYSIQTHKPGYEDWLVRHVTCAEAVAAGRISGEWTEARKRQWGENSALYRNRVLGEFAEMDEAGVIPLPLVEAANERWVAWAEAGFPGIVTSLGVDVGGGGDGNDSSRLATIVNLTKVRAVEEIHHGDVRTATMELANEVARAANSQEVMIMVDVGGIGAGTLARLRQMRYNANPFNAAYRTFKHDISGELGFLNWRAAAWWALREMLEEGSGFEVCLPPDDDLTAELIAPRWTLARPRRLDAKREFGLIQIEDKKEVRRRIGRSPDRADAILHGMIGPLLLEESLGGGDEEEDEGYERQRIGDY
jgi:hypothetical protein